MKKRFVGALMCMCMAASALTGCGSAQGGSGSLDGTDALPVEEAAATSPAEENTDVSPSQDGEISGTITVLTNRTDLVDTKFAEYADSFEAKYPGTEVKFESITDYEGDVAIRLQTEEYGGCAFHSEFHCKCGLSEFF